MSREVWVVMDATYSWTGEISAHGVYSSLEEARNSICDNPDIIDAFMNTNAEGKELREISDDAKVRLFGNDWKNLEYEGYDHYISTYDALNALSEENREKAENVMYKTISSCVFHED